MDKYEYLTGEYLGYKPEVLEQAKFEYFGKFWVKFLMKHYKKLIKLIKLIRQ